MCIVTRQKEIIITSSNVPVIRSGFSNILFFLLFIAVIVVNRILNDFNVSLVPKALIILFICVVTLQIYCRSVSKIYFKDGSGIVIVGPIFESKIDASQIEKIDVYGIPSSMTIFLTIKMKKTRLPKWYFFIAVSTNCGSFEATRTRLTEISSEIVKSTR